MVCHHDLLHLSRPRKLGLVLHNGLQDRLKIKVDTYHWRMLGKNVICDVDLNFVLRVFFYEGRGLWDIFGLKDGVGAFCVALYLG